MTETTLPGPSADSWVASVHAGQRDLRPLGSALVIDVRRVLTCAHVILTGRTIREHLWVCFAKLDALGDDRRRVVSVEWIHEPPVTDIAVLELDRDVPEGVEPAPLRCPRPNDLVGKRWWAFGFPDGDPIGDSADGLVGGALAHGWVRLDTTSRYLVRPGFSGAGLWSPDYDAIVGVVGQAHANGDGRAVMLHRADQWLPKQRLGRLAVWSAQAAGEVALAAWGWSLAIDPEGIRHWRPRARGVSRENERGYRFRGRVRALTEITEWLDRPMPDGQVLVVTGSPGVGKSAILGRIVTTADAAIVTELPDSDDGVRARIGTVACAVHAKAKTALEVATEIAQAASARLPAEPQELALAIRQALEERPARRRFNVIIDALDEAASPAQARIIIRQIAQSLMHLCSDIGVQVIVGTRRHDDGGSLLDHFAGTSTILDLDDSAYFAASDLAAYALACLRLADDRRRDGPYDDDDAALPLADRIAELSGRNFLIAGLVARSCSLNDDGAADPRDLTFDATVDSALASYLARVGSVNGLPADHVLTGLAFAEAPGLPTDLWRLAVESVYNTSVQVEVLSGFAHSAAANFLVESGDEGSAQPVFRLFHQALNDALARARAAVAVNGDDERALATAFISRGRRSGWQDVPEYLLRSLPVHASTAGMIDDLLTDDAYLLHADLRRLLSAGHPSSEPAQQRVQLLGLTPEAITAAAGERAALFSVTQALEHMDQSYAEHPNAPYLARWAHTRPRGARAVLEGHQSEVFGVCSVEVAGRQLLASVGGDRTVRVWDPLGGALRVLEGHQGVVWAVCPVEVAGRQLLASAGGDGTVRVWDPLGGALRVLEGHQGVVWAVCPVEVAGRQLLASAGRDGTVRVWDSGGKQRLVLQGHEGQVFAVCAVGVAGKQMLVSASSDGTLKVWSPLSGEPAVAFQGYQGQVFALCAVEVAGKQMLASAGEDGTVRVWDPGTGEQLAVLQGHQDWVRGVCAVEVAGRQLLASAGEDGTVRVWDPGTGEQQAVLKGHQGGVREAPAVTRDGPPTNTGDLVTVGQMPVGNYQNWVRGVCAVEVAGQRLLASGGSDGTVRLWDANSGIQQAELDGHRGTVLGVCGVQVDGRQMLASSGSDGTVWLWDLLTRERRAVMDRFLGGIRGVCAVEVAGRPLLASAGGDGTVRVWDISDGKQLAVLQGRRGGIRAVCAVQAEQQLLASAGSDGTVRLWDPNWAQRRVLAGHHGSVNGVCAVGTALASAGSDGTVRLWNPNGAQRRVLEGHHGSVNGVCAVDVAGRKLLASASSDRTVRLWDPAAAACVLTIPVHHEAMTISGDNGLIAIGLSAGILAIELRVLAI